MVRILHEQYFSLALLLDLSCAWRMRYTEPLELLQLLRGVLAEVASMLATGRGSAGS